MDSDRKKINRTLWMISAAMSFPFILAAGPVAGYFIGQYILVNQFNMETNIVPWLVGLGFIGSGFQISSLIKKINSLEEKK